MQMHNWYLVPIVPYGHKLLDSQKKICSKQLEQLQYISDNYLINFEIIQTICRHFAYQKMNSLLKKQRRNQHY